MVAALLTASTHGHQVASAAAAPATAPPAATVLAAGAIAVVLVLGLWSLAGHVITIAHEGGHALMAVLLGARIREIRLNRDQSGSTASTAALLQLPVTFAGYVGPSAFGLLGSVLLVHGNADAVLWFSLVLLGLLLLSTANWFGRLVLVAVGAVLFLCLQQEAPDVRVLVACAWVWLLLIGGVLHVWNHRRGGADFAALRSMTFVVPAVVWAGIALIAAVAALLTGGAWLVGAASPPF